MRKNKYLYWKVIQQHYGQGWEDVSHYETNSSYQTKPNDSFLYDLKEYRSLRYPTRVVQRKELNKEYNWTERIDNYLHNIYDYLELVNKYDYLLFQKDAVSEKDFFRACARKESLAEILKFKDPVQFNLLVQQLTNEQ